MNHQHSRPTSEPVSHTASTSLPLPCADLLATLTDKSYFYFIRHGQSEANREGIIQGHAESPLSSKGKRQALAAGKWLKGKHIDAVYTSPLGRASQTAHIISRRCSLEPQVHPSVCEIDTGVFTDKTWLEVERDYPVVSRRFRIESWEAVPQAERIPSLTARAAVYWDHLIETANSGARRIVTVTHGGMLQWLIKATMGSTKWMPLIPAANCAIFMFYVRPEKYHSHTDDANSTVRGAYSAWQMVNVIPY